MILVAIRAFVYLTSAAVLYVWLLLQVENLDKVIAIPLPTWLQVPGMLLVVVGSALFTACYVYFVLEGHGTPFPLDPPKQLVIAGPYRLTRNPLYLGWTAVYIGFGFYAGSPSDVFLGLLFFGACWLFIVCVEEPRLKKRFGTSYELYCQTVPRFVPKMRLTKASNR